MTSECREVLIQLAVEFDEAFAFEKERFLSVFPDGDMDHTIATSVRAQVFRNLAEMLRARVKNDEAKEALDGARGANGANG